MDIIKRKSNSLEGEALVLCTEVATTILEIEDELYEYLSDEQAEQIAELIKSKFAWSIIK